MMLAMDPELEELFDCGAVQAEMFVRDASRRRLDAAQLLANGARGFADDLDEALIAASRKPSPAS